MYIERDLKNFIIYSEDYLTEALRKINLNKTKFIFSVTENGVLEGIITDGDIRRWLTQNNQINLNVPVRSLSNKDFVSLPIETANEEINKYFNERITFIPLLDNKNHLIAFASKNQIGIKIGNFIIGESKPTFIIAEIGNNHNGNLGLAKKLVDQAKNSGADCVKFQLRDMTDLYRNKSFSKRSDEDLGSEYTLDLLRRFQLKNEEMFEIFDYCKKVEILPLCTPWDIKSLNALENYGLLAYKVASADLSNHQLISAIVKTGKPLICSTGMSKESEIIDLVRLLKKSNAQYILLHCNSTYPAPFKDINLNYIDRLIQIGNCDVGYSGHERGIAVAMAAVAKGAKVIEKHFTLDKNMEGNDHKVSLLPQEFKNLVNGIREIEESLGISSSRTISQGEMINREVLAKSLVINCSLKKNDFILENMIEIKSPGKGLPPYKIHELIGKKAKRDFKKGDFFYQSDIDSVMIKPRKYSFKRPFGIPVRYHDIEKIGDLSNFDLIEFHMSYKDLEINPNNFLNQNSKLDFIVHSPELFSGDHLMDLCSSSDKYRARSINELQNVINVTNKLKSYFPKTKKPLIIINPGGFSLDRFKSEKDRPKLHDEIAISLKELDSNGVEIIPQTMPPYPWHFGGQRYHNAFVHPDDIDYFCSEYGYRICLDVSHSQLACNFHKILFSDFLRKIAQHTAHMHLVDADGVDAEGLQIGEGRIDFELLASMMSQLSPESSFIPEIWQGHKNDGEGFWIALERLEKFF